MKILKNIALFLFLSVFITIILKLLVIQIYNVESDSMYKTIKPGSKLIISKIGNFQNNDIVVYKDIKGDLCISEIVASENDTVRINRQKVYINGQEVKNKSQVLSYCIRFIHQHEADSLQSIYKLRKYGNSGIYEIQLTDNEYESIMNDSFSDLKLNIFPFEFLHTDLFSKKINIKDIIIGVDTVFLLNHNRADLNDSRSFGAVNKDVIIGKLIKKL